MPDSRRRRWSIFLLLALGPQLAGCVPIGPDSVRSDQVDYADAISEARKRLALTNIVKTRYGDAASYLVASQVVAGYQLQTTVSANADLVQDGGWKFGDSGGLSIGGQFNNSPTITYTPVSGADFAALLLQPIAPADTYALINGGNPPDLVFGLVVSQINGLRNSLLEPADASQNDRPFEEFLQIALRLHRTNRIHLRFEVQDKARRSFIVLPAPGRGGADQADVERFRELLGLDPERTEFEVHYGSGTGAPESIQILTRSISEILRDLASLIDVPPDDVSSGRTQPTITTDAAQLKRVRIRARTGRLPPLTDDVYVRCYYRGRWFWIDDNDFRSKQVFSFVIELLQLAQTTSSPTLPVITIPNG